MKRIKMIPFYPLTLSEKKYLLSSGYTVIPISGYKNAFKIIGPVDTDIPVFDTIDLNILLDPWDTFHLTAKYINLIYYHRDFIVQHKLIEKLSDEEILNAARMNWPYVKFDEIIVNELISRSLRPPNNSNRDIKNLYKEMEE